MWCQDLESTADFISLFVVCAPGEFFPDDFPDLNYQSAIEALTAGIKRCEAEIGKQLVDDCLQLLSQAVSHYEKEQNALAQKALYKIEKILDRHRV